MNRTQIRKHVTDKVNEIQQSNPTQPLKILDVGGGHFPFALATHVVDVITWEDYERIQEQGKYNKARFWGANEIRFSKQTWNSVNVCNNKLPFQDKYFDFCVCCHTLEDIPNPFKAVEEINRVSKAGYIEVPSKEIECTLGVEGGILGRRYPGNYHHIWMFSIKENRLIIEPKLSYIGSSRCYSFANRFVKRWRASGNDVVEYFWENEIRMQMIDISVFDDIKEMQKNYIKSKAGYNLQMLLFELHKKLKKGMIKVD